MIASLRKQQWAIAKPWQTNVALIMLGGGLVAFTHQLISEYDHFTIGFSGVSGWSAILYALAVLLILTQPANRYTFPIILVFAIACRLITLFPDPYLSSDVYRYVWDGVVQHAHISPYRYVPGDPALAFLRHPNQDTYDSINRRDYAVTIYPPAAQFLFYCITFISPTVEFMKMAMVLFEGLTMVALVALLRELGIRREQTLLYAWCPLLIWEIGSSGHLDAVAMAFIALALLFRYRDRPVVTGLFLGLAIITKIYPVVLFPALYRRGDWKMPATAVAVIAFGYAGYASVGMKVFGFLGGYVQEEGIQTGTRYFLLELTQHLPGLHTLGSAPYLAFVALVFLALTIWCWRTCCAPTPPRSTAFGLPGRAYFLLPCAALTLALMLLFSPHYPWYIAWIVPFFTLIPDITLMAYICGLFYMCTTALATGSGVPQFQLNVILYRAVFFAFMLDVVLRRWPIHRQYFLPRPEGDA